MPPLRWKRAVRALIPGLASSAREHRSSLRPAKSNFPRHQAQLSASLLNIPEPIGVSLSCLLGAGQSLRRFWIGSRSPALVQAVCSADLRAANSQRITSAPEKMAFHEAMEMPKRSQAT